MSKENERATHHMILSRLWLADCMHVCIFMYLCIDEYSYCNDKVTGKKVKQTFW